MTSFRFTAAGWQLDTADHDPSMGEYSWHTIVVHLGHDDLTRGCIEVALSAAEEMAHDRAVDLFGSDDFDLTLEEHTVEAPC